MLTIRSDRQLSKGAGNSRILAVMLLAATLCAAAPALAVDKHWVASNGSWAVPQNWSPIGVPQASDIVYVDFWNGAPGTAQVGGNEPDPVSIHIANGNTVRINGVIGNVGSLASGGDFIVGFQGTQGTLNVTSSNPGVVFYNGSVTVGNTMRIGTLSGGGVVNQNDGIVNVNQKLRVADSNAASKFTGDGTYNLSGVGVLNAARLEVGYGGDTAQFPNMLGTFNLSGGQLNISTGAQVPDPKIGGGGSTGIFNQTGGTFNSPFRIIDIAPNGGTGVYNYSGGVFTVPGVNFSNNNSTFNYLAQPYLYMNQVSMSRGKIVVSPGANKLLESRLLWTSSSNWFIDLNDNAMIVGATLGESVQSALFRGFSNGAWNGTGIRSTAAANAPPLTRALGFAQASDLGVTEWGGHAVAPMATIIQYTRMGDANLDLVVDSDDFNRLAANFGLAGKFWSQGDFNFDQVVSSHDFNLLASNFGLSAGPDGVVDPGDWAALAAAVPEPSGALLVLAGAAVSLLRPGRRAFERGIRRFAR